MNHDDLLVKKTLAGDDLAFKEIVDTYKGYVFAIILKFISDSYTAEDIAQEVFLQIYRSLPQFQNRSFKSWIGKIAVNKAIDYKRAQGKIREKELTEGVDGVMIKGKYPTPEEILLSKSRRQEVYISVAKLPEVYARALQKYYFEGKSYKDIASEEGVTVKTVESRLYRAKGLFRKNWGREDV